MGFNIGFDANISNGVQFQNPVFMNF